LLQGIRKLSVVRVAILHQSKPVTNNSAFSLQDKKCILSWFLRGKIAPLRGEKSGLTIPAESSEEQD
jgi:hypothetical protein